MARIPLAVRIVTKGATIDAGGGITSTPVVGATVYYALLRQHRKHEAHRQERSYGYAEGPGIQVIRGEYFKFMQPAPSVAIDDLIQEVATGKRWRVMTDRSYDRTYQVDVERVE